jgi:hypothetical protein
VRREHDAIVAREYPWIDGWLVFEDVEADPAQLDSSC